ncbi:hypothetical protein [Microbacterium aurantiacum]|uniref:Cation-transporting ATPase n=1 Tax=Microbacterium aurantiacum TaxID=162393 RepID=A0A0M8MJZ8_9MICO|nr:hypothetical protein [Microbacterium chocolatum]ANG84411.1 hypothetical protein A8L33_02535 [Microbacterium chocolatum]KOS11657.1 hypothetical protein XI38_03665 [Microbacterium chocolatum]
MSTFSRLFDIAFKALGSASGSSAQGSTPSGAGATRPGAAGATDWRGLVGKVAEAVTGDGRAGQSGTSAPSGHPGPSPAYTPPTAPASAGRPTLAPPPAGATGARPVAGSEADRRAIARYDYLLQTADPHQVEQIHRDAFARLTPGQREQVEARMRSELPPALRPASASAPDLARAAGRAEASQPGRMRGLLARVGTGAAVGAGAAAGVGLLGLVAGGAVVSTVAGPLLAEAAGLGIDLDALAGGVDVEGIAGSMGGFAEDQVSGLGEQVSGLGEQISGFGEQFGGFELPGLGDIFGR